MDPMETEITAPSTPIKVMTASNTDLAQIQQDHPTIPLEMYSEGMVPPEFSRLIVLVPDRDVDEAAFTHKVWDILGGRRASVIFVSLVTNGEYGPGAQRRLVTLAAVAQDTFYQIETRIIFGRSWIPGLKEIARSGDLIVCHAMQQSRSFFGQDAALADQVVAELEKPVYVLSGLYNETVTPRPSRILRHATVWGILAGMVSAFFVLEAAIQHMTTGWMSRVLLILVFGVELLFVWMWNQFNVSSG